MKKQKQKKPDGRCATKTKSDFVRARLLGEAFKIITEEPPKEPYLTIVR